MISFNLIVLALMVTISVTVAEVRSVTMAIVIYVWMCVDFNHTETAVFASVLGAEW